MSYFKLHGRPVTLISFICLILFFSLNADGQHRPYKIFEINKNGIPPLLDNINSSEDWEVKKKEIRQVWMDILGGLPERPAVGYKVLSETRMRDHIRKKIIFNTINDDSVTAFLLIPDKLKKGERRAAVLALHATNTYGKRAVATPFMESDSIRSYGYELVSRGYVVLAPDDLTSGERIYPGEKPFISRPFYEKSPEWSIIAKTLVDHMQALDLLEQLDFVDSDHFGVIGVSFGGYNSFFLSSVDQRIKAVVTICGLSTMKGDPNIRRWGVRPQFYTHFPKMTGYFNKGEIPFEITEIVALSAPTPMFFYAAQNDLIFPHWESISEGLNDIYKLYKWLGFPERFQYSIGPGGHTFPDKIRDWAFEFFDENLK